MVALSPSMFEDGVYTGLKIQDKFQEHPSFLVVFCCCCFFLRYSSPLTLIHSQPSIWKWWNSHSSVWDVIVDIQGQHLYYSTGEYKKGWYVKNRVSHIHTADCWHTSRFDLCLIWCVETSLLPTCVCLGPRLLVCAEHIKMLWKSFKHLLRVASALNHVAWLHLTIMPDQQLHGTPIADLYATLVSIIR